MRQRMVTALLVIGIVMSSAAGTLLAQDSGGLSPIKGEGRKVTTERHVFTVAPTGLPRKLRIEPAPAELPLQYQDAPEKIGPGELLRLGRGNQLREPMAVEVMVEGNAAETSFGQKAKLSDRGDDHRTYRSRFTSGPVTCNLKVTYGRDGSITGELTYSGSGKKVDSVELVVPIRGTVSLAYNGPRTGKKGVESVKKLNPTLPLDPNKVVWKNTRDAKNVGAEGTFVRSLYVGSRDRGFTWLCDSSEGWVLDESKPMMTLRRDKNGLVSWRMKIVNHPVKLKGKRTVRFALLTHPARMPRPDRRRAEWLEWPAEGKARPNSPAQWSLSDYRDAGKKDVDVLGALAGGAFEALCPRMELTGEAGAEMKSRKQDTVDLYPAPLFSIFAGTSTALTTRLRPNAREVLGIGSAANPAYNRQYLGRALLHDIGVSMQGLSQPVQYTRLVKELKEFGLFDSEVNIEVMPYWRNGDVVRYGEKFSEDDAFELTVKNPARHVRVTVFRRAREGGGYEALFVIMNDGPEDIRKAFYILDPKRIFGGDNSLLGKDITSAQDYSKVPPDGDWRKERLVGRIMGGRQVLRNMDTGGMVAAANRQPADKEIYGPVFVRSHNYLLLYGYSD